VIGLESSFPQFNRDPPIAISTFILNADIPDRLSLFEMLLGLMKMFQVIVIAAPGKLGCCQEPF